VGSAWNEGDRILDCALADRSVTWLGSECDKRRNSKERFGNRLRDDEYPRLSPAALDAAIRLSETGTETVRAAVEKRGGGGNGGPEGPYSLRRVGGGGGSRT
jgi:hypothetical protein